jgi:nitrate/nitrite transport system ATP-binding protein
MALLELEGVAKSFGEGPAKSEVLEDIQLEVEPGEFIAIVGFSGSGKSTLMGLISGLIEPDAGTIRFKGEPVRGAGPDRGVVFQNYSLLPWLDVYENVALAVDQVFPSWPRAKRRAHTERYIEMVNLSEARGKKPHELSGGMRQRVSVARALAMGPELLLLDEPLSALDALTRATLQDELERIWRCEQKTVILITNDVDEGLLLADRIIALKPGPPATLGESFPVDLGRPRVRQSLNRDPAFRGLRNRVLRYLTDVRASSRKQAAQSSRRLVLPSLAPRQVIV